MGLDQATYAAIEASLDWHERNDPEGHEAVLAACRAWRFLEEGRWYSEDEAAAWFAERAPDPGVFERALAARRGEEVGPVAPEDVRALTALVRERLGRGGSMPPPERPDHPG